MTWPRPYIWYVEVQTGAIGFRVPPRDDWAVLTFQAQIRNAPVPYLLHLMCYDPSLKSPQKMCSNKPYNKKKVLIIFKEGIELEWQQFQKRITQVFLHTPLRPLCTVRTFTCSLTSPLTFDHSLFSSYPFPLPY